jgi:hypothetical protein
MTGKTGIRGVFETVATGCSVRAQVWKKNRGFKMVSFDPSSIDHLTDNEDGTSEIVLKSGLEIQVNMPFSELEKKVFHSHFMDGDFIDLMAVTGVHSGFPSRQDPQDTAPLNEITMHIRKRGTRETVIDVCKSEEWFDWENIREIKDINGPAIIIPLTGEVKSNLKEKHVLLDISYSEFMRLYKAAKAAGSVTLDLTPITGRFVSPSPPADRMAGPGP